MIIDDEKDLVHTIKSFLSSRNFDISYAYDGNSGLEAIKKEKPDVIILDIMMPEKDGRGVLSELKKNEETRNIPVIMLTAKEDQYIRDYMLELGAYEYITKPYDSNILLRQINNVLNKKKDHEI
jgi:two-component system alkaline phosphatase synthesis response regulator PhoP